MRACRELPRLGWTSQRGTARTSEGARDRRLQLQMEARCCESSRLLVGLGSGPASRPFWHLPALCQFALTDLNGKATDWNGRSSHPVQPTHAWRNESRGYRVCSTAKSPCVRAFSVLGTALFDVEAVSGGGGGMVMVRDIEFASTSSANLLPFHGRCHIAYMPARGVVLGLSKFARLTGLFARRFQDQQQFTDQVTAPRPPWTARFSASRLPYAWWLPYAWCRARAGCRC